MFTSSGRVKWPEAFGLISSFEFYAALLTGDPNADMGPNTFEGLVAVEAFEQLAIAGKAIEVEMPCVKPGAISAIDGTDNQHAAKVIVDRLAPLGIDVSAFNLDEPLNAGLHLIQPRLSIDVTAQFTADWIHALRGQAYAIRLIEPYPACSADEILQFWAALSARDATPDALVLDIDPWALRNARPKVSEKDWTADVRRLRADTGGTLHVLAWGHDADTEREYCEEARGWAKTLRRTGVPCERITIQSWARRSADGPKNMPANLPESNRDTHTGLLREIAVEWCR